MKRTAITLFLAALLTATPIGLAHATTLSISLGWGTIPDQFAESLRRYTEQTGVQFDIATPAGNVNQYHQSLLVQFAAGTAPDLLFVEGQWIEQFVAADLLLQLDAHYDRDVDFSEFLAIFDASRVDGGLYGFPAVGGGYRVNGLYINRDHFHAAGLPVPGPNIEDALDYQQLSEAARRLTIDRNNDGTPNQWGINFGLGWSGWTGWIPSNGASVFNESKTEVLLDSPEAIEVFQLLQDLNFHYGARGGNFPQGTTSMHFGIRANILAFTPAIGESFDWSVAPVPQGAAGSVGVLNMNSVAINVDSPLSDEAWKFILFLASEEEQTPRAAEGVAVARRSSAILHQMLDQPPYDLAPFLTGRTVNRQAMTMPGGAAWPQEADAFLQQVIEGTMDATTGTRQAADVIRRAMNQ